VQLGFHSSPGTLDLGLWISSLGFLEQAQELVRQDLTLLGQATESPILLGLDLRICIWSGQLRSALSHLARDDLQAAICLDQAQSRTIDLSGPADQLAAEIDELHDGRSQADGRQWVHHPIVSRLELILIRRRKCTSRLGYPPCVAPQPASAHCLACNLDSELEVVYEVTIAKYNQSFTI
jgi:hypothetical protein